MRRPPQRQHPQTPEEIVEYFLHAYRQGAFPMAELPGGVPGGGSRGGAGVLPMARSIHWYRPDPRAVLPLEDGGLRVPRSVQRTIRKADFVLTADVAFERVIRSCAEPRPSRGGAWLDESLVRVYTLLHQHGDAHSIEAWHPTSGELVGGIYGVSIGSFFAAESMFSDVEAGGSGASSACLSALWHHLRSCGYTLLDVQIANEHTLRFGVQEIPCEEYSRQLKAAVERPGAWKPFTTSA